VTCRRYCQGDLAGLEQKLEAIGHIQGELRCSIQRIPSREAEFLFLQLLRCPLLIVSPAHNAKLVRRTNFAEVINHYIFVIVRDVRKFSIVAEGRIRSSQGLDIQHGLES
jgi:hypothetical protein